MSDALWVVRAGEGAKYVDEFEANSYIAINFYELATDDLSLVDEATVRARAGSPSDRNFAAQLVAFAYRMEIGDFVIVPRLRGKRRDYLVGRVTGDYEHVRGAQSSGCHRRRVEWLGRFDRDALSPPAVNTMGAIQTVFRPTAVEAELQGLFTALTPLDVDAEPPQPRPAAGTPAGAMAATASGSPVRVASSARPLAPAQVDITIDATGRARIMCGHPALVMEQTPRHVNPDADWRGVPGIYVLTGTDLEQSSSWTGNERTLTTTLIVRPWAYVGLSEDFLGRIGSHRQSKPEWRRALLVRSGGQPFSGDDIRYLERSVHTRLHETGEVRLTQALPRGNLSAVPRNPAHLDTCADTVVSVLRLTGTLI